MSNMIDSYKGFDKDLKCRGFQFEPGVLYEHAGAVEVCNSGFHACRHPLGVFRYRPPSISRYFRVKQGGALSEGDSDSKVASQTIFLEDEMSISDLVAAALVYANVNCAGREGITDTGEYGAASATGNYGADSAAGNREAASATGNRGVASATAYRGAASATGYQGAASATGKTGIAVAVGNKCKAMAMDGGAIVLVYRDDSGDIVHIRASKVGENGILPGVWYTLDEQGEFVAEQ